MVLCWRLVSCKKCRNFCAFYTFLFQASQGWMYSTKKYREATTKKEQCKVPLKPDLGSNQDQMQKLRKEYHEYCPKSKSNNIVFCPEKIIKRKKDKRVQWINDYFTNLLKKRRKKKTKKKGKERRNKKKRKEKKGRKRKKNKKKRRRKKEKKSKFISYQ